jgi:hypothetical protein
MVDLHRNARRYTPERHNLHSHSCEKHKPNPCFTVWNRIYNARLLYSQFRTSRRDIETEMWLFQNGTVFNLILRAQKKNPLLAERRSSIIITFTVSTARLTLFIAATDAFIQEGK